ncbi:MAG: C40 family peptidase [Bryobacterales bacterium]|nr:C40 family peptidase [Bryobacterales bacterium]
MRLLASLLILGAAALEAQAPPAEERLSENVRHYLGLPYAWGSSGLKSFDCSGFVWRVYTESGFHLKRTTARKYYFSLKAVPAGERPRFGTLVFFDNLKHMGIVNDKDTFFHAQSSKGTNLSELRPYWSGLVCGYRRVSE